MIILILTAAQMVLNVPIRFLVSKCRATRWTLWRGESFIPYCLDRQACGRTAITVSPSPWLNGLDTFYEASPRTVFVHGAIKYPCWYAQRLHTLKNNSDSLLMSSRSEMSQWGLFWFFTSWNMSSRTNMLLKKIIIKETLMGFDT